MEQGYIKITESEKYGFVVEAKLINGGLWISKWQMATLFNVFTKTIESNLSAIFKAGLLKENEVSCIHTFINNGRKNELALYNLDTLILVGFRIPSFEAKAFREWVIKSFSEYARNGCGKFHNAIIVLNSHFKETMSISLN
jgi:Virulence protein